MAAIARKLDLGYASVHRVVAGSLKAQGYAPKRRCSTSSADTRRPTALESHGRWIRHEGAPPGQGTKPLAR